MAPITEGNNHSRSVVTGRLGLEAAEQTHQETNDHESNDITREDSDSRKASKGRLGTGRLS